jgi:hypothetical protein
MTGPGGAWTFASPDALEVLTNVLVALGAVEAPAEPYDLDIKCVIEFLAESGRGSDANTVRWLRAERLRLLAETGQTP